MLKAEDYYQYLSQQIEDDSYSNLEKHHKIKDLLEWICKEETKGEKVLLSSLFSRIAFISQKKKLPELLSWRLQKIRINDRQSKRSTKFISDHDVQFAARGVAELIKEVHGVIIPEKLDHSLPDLPSQELVNRHKENTIEVLKVEVLRIDTDNNRIICLEDDEENETTAPLEVRFNVSGYNDIYTAFIHKLWENAQLLLINARMEEDDSVSPQHFVLEPDYLIDVTAVAECFSRNTTIPLMHLLKKFSTSTSSTAMLLGNVANYFLDEAIHSEDTDILDFRDVFTKTFKASPLEYITLDELQTKDGFNTFMKKAEDQFNNIKRTIKEDFLQQNIYKDGCIIEPSFYSPKYGLQGRLDLLHINQHQKEFRIVELKSGTPPQVGFGNSGLWINHQVQTLMYQMILRDAYNVESKQVFPYIFYSKTIQSPLRFDTFTLKLEQSILLTRNEIVLNEFRLSKAETLQEVHKVICQLNESAFAGAPPFTKTEVNEFIRDLKGLNRMEKAYLYAFTSFISKEQQLSKVGDTIFNQGAAALWKDDFEEKKDSFKIFFDLEVTDNYANEPVPELIFKRTNEENAFVNFRVGDIVTIYPRQSADTIPTQGQINRGTITFISNSEVRVQLRHRQRNSEIYDADTKWALEGDFMEASFNTMYRGIFNFISWENKEKKARLLGLNPPKYPDKMYTHEEVKSLAQDKNLNETELSTLSKALSTEDYCLVVGPPGTGKTSRMLKNLAHILHKTDKTRNILFVAYTNRAVDEICEALDEAIEAPLEDGRKFLRIGSEHSCSPQWKENLMHNLAQNANNRKMLRNGIEQHRIFVSTLASIAGRSSLFKIKQFDMAVIDEASQILEPQIVSLLTKVNRFVLIGDQKQLPAITQQDPVLSEIDFEELKEIGLTDRRTAYFERIYALCQKNNWHWAFDRLKNQGRMHEVLGDFANQQFYQGNLTTVPLPWQSASFEWDQLPEYSDLEKLLVERRLLFFPTTGKNTSTSDKINMEEARKIAKIAVATKKRYLEQKGSFDIDKTLGIIAPYRNQIAAIRQALEEEGFEDAHLLSIDTVERYQGSQREVILISFCANTPFQLEGMISLTSDHKVDRKLNVAITRAKQQMIFFGNPYILMRSSIHESLMNWVRDQKGWIDNDNLLF
ncbi:AAA family ATPase [Flammeovirga yaeyamensis]|uniref:DNA helicase n=1 Tax=Flammeovirga yaeyamensis TaxID=367791 RepID=A0AAX1N6N9_9BACT|nr:AAA domain-containing protein [Flammeovirga yaeyamensis]MBB3697819.1 DNA replication ATP-dependent helicase Dna2 [Flammeovirga yaeyamensis]NMF35825.1 AAA family ATPase [Flammeovirga yaeyamensis]QWG03223.1 AAA family ATPase [Flammeovirga yaeyamensis]